MNGKKVGRPFAPGQSGNPGGRPKAVREVQELARAHTTIAIARLVHIAEHGKSESAQIAAAVALLDRGWGKPAQSLEVEQKHSVDPESLTEAELAAIIARGEAANGLAG